MSLRILHLASLPVEPPFLSAHAANAAWLAPALRERGHDVTLRVVEQPATTAAAADSEGFDIVHIHDATSLERPVPQGATPVVVTRYSPEDVCQDIPWIALSYRSAERAASPPVAVIAPSLDTATMPPALEPGDELLFAFDGHDTYALSAAIAVARSSERPLAILIEDPFALTQEARDRLDEARRFTRGIPSRAWKADDLAGAACYLSFGRNAFDMAALTAMAAGVPVLTFDGFPAAEVIVHGESGFAVRSTEEAVRALGWLDLLRPELSRGRARVLFDAEVAALRHEAIYEQLARGNRPVFRHPETGPGIYPARTWPQPEVAVPSLA